MAWWSGSLPMSSLEQSAIDYIEKLAVTSAPLAMAATKRLVYQHLGRATSPP